MSWIVLRALTGKHVQLFHDSTICCRVWPQDMDINPHMNNGRYLTMMDLGRIDLFLRSGGLGVIKKRRGVFLVGAQTIQFRRSLRVFESYTIRTRIVGWDKKWIYFDQHFERDGKDVAIGYVRGLFQSGGRNLSPEDVVSDMGEQCSSPALPGPIAAWVGGLDSARAG